MPKNLLLADDSVTIQKVVGITFVGEDFHVTAVDNGDDAIARARELKPDILVVDVTMPKKNGYEVCEIAKADAALKHIPVLLLTGTYEPFDEARARAVRADGHIAKPFEAQALVAKVKELVSAAPRPAASAPAAQPRPAAAPVAARPSAPAPIPDAPRPAAPIPAFKPAPVSPVPAPRPAFSSSPGGLPPMPSRPIPPRPVAPAIAVPRAMPPPGRPPLPSVPPFGAKPPPPAPLPPIARPAPAAPLGGRFPMPAAAPASSRPAAPAKQPPAPLPVTLEPTPPPAAQQPLPPSMELDWSDIDVVEAPPEPAAPEPVRAAARPATPAVAPPAAAAPVAAAIPNTVLTKLDEIDFGAPSAFAARPPPAVAPTPAPSEVADLPLLEADQLELAPAADFVPEPEQTGHAWDAQGEASGAGSSAALGEVVEGLLEPLEPVTLPEAGPVAPRPALAADGGEAQLREALSRASREVIERIAWEVVPQLAEVIIREQIERLAKDRLR